MQFRINSLLVALVAAAVLVGTAGVAQADLIAHWAFDDGTNATTAEDETGNHDGTVDTASGYGPTTGQTGKLDEAYLFSGHESPDPGGQGGVTVSSSAGGELETFTNLTLCQWFNVHSWLNKSPPIIYKDNFDGTSTTMSYLTWTVNDDYFQGRFGDGTGGTPTTLRVQYPTGTSPNIDSYADDLWHQLTVSYEGPVHGTSGLATAKLYLDGKLLATQTDSTFKGITPTGYDLYLGVESRGKDSVSYAFNGYLDDLGIWSDTLSHGKANSIYNVVEKLGLAYDLSDMKELFKVFDDNSPDTIGGLDWVRDNNLPDPTLVDPTAELGFAWSAGGNYYVWLDNGSYQGVKAVIPEPSTLMLLATGLIGLLAYGWRRRK